MKLKHYIFIGIFIISTIIYFGVKDGFPPLKRSNIKTPIYTIGDVSYLESIKEGKSVVKFGPLFWGLYPGGLAFNSPEQAKKYLSDHKEAFYSISDQWMIFELSGDYDLDTYSKENTVFTNKSLLATKLVKKILN